MKETGLTSSVRKFMFVCSLINRNINFFLNVELLQRSILPIRTKMKLFLTPPLTQPPPPPKKKRIEKERKVIDGGLNTSLLEHYNFVYFNDVTINTSCPYHNLCEKLTTTISVCTLRLTLGYLHTFSRGDSYSNIGLFQDHCSYALVPHS